MSDVNVPGPARKAAIFDFDGTLFDTDSVHLACWQSALAAFGGEVDRDTYMRDCAGRLTILIAESLFARNGIEADPAALADRKEAAFKAWLAHNRVAWMPHARETLEHFESAGWAVAIVTAGPRDVVHAALDSHRLHGRLAALVTRDDVAHSKPAPDCYALCVRRLGAAPADCVVFEDSASGVQAAVAAGLRCLAVRPPSAGPQDFTGAVQIFPDLREARNWLAATSSPPVTR